NIQKNEMMKEKGIDIIFHNNSELNPDYNIHYLTGYPETGILIHGRNEEKVIAAFDTQLAEKSTKNVKVVTKKEWFYDKGDNMARDIENVAGTKDPVIGVTSNIGYGDFFQLKRKIKKILPKASFTKNPFVVDSIFEKIRRTKTSKEIKLIRKACSISSDTIPLIIDYIKNNPSLTEKDLAMFMENSMTSRGGDGLAFETIVASPKRSWQIHTYPRAGTNKLFTNGIGLTDYGTKYKGYCSDITLPFIFNKINKKQELIVETVIEAAQAAIDEIYIGKPVHELFDIANAKIEKAGFTLPHSLGHGFGLFIHESPSLSPKPQDPKTLKSWKPSLLEENMVFTIEPGIYDIKNGGYRLENDILVTKGKKEILTKSKKTHLIS
ncbi:MAG: M24 family metallopeptidase, partial [Candidatus Ranarchaeia archaeon]